MNRLWVSVKVNDPLVSLVKEFPEVSIEPYKDQGEHLVFKAQTLGDVYEIAERFYERCEQMGLKKVQARLRHRFGRNGHGWPTKEKAPANLANRSTGASTASH